METDSGAELAITEDFLGIRDLKFTIKQKTVVLRDLMRESVGSLKLRCIGS
jgi:hypothetical protein